MVSKAKQQFQISKYFKKSESLKIIWNPCPFVTGYKHPTSRSGSSAGVAGRSQSTLHSKVTGGKHGDLTRGISLGHYFPTSTYIYMAPVSHTVLGKMKST